MSRLGVGEVVRIRISPHDVMTAIDIVDTLGLYVQGMSFAQCVSVALKAVFESCRHSKLVEARDGFEYSEMLARFPRDTPGIARRRGRQIDITNTFNRGLGEEGRVIGLVKQEFKEPDPFTHQNPRVRTLAEMIQALEQKRSVDPDNWDAQNQEEYDRLQKELCGLI